MNLKVNIELTPGDLSELLVTSRENGEYSLEA